MRVKRGTAHVKRRKNLLKKTKGFHWGRKNKIKQARIASLKAGVHAYRGRKVKKQEYRHLWQIKINAGVRPYGLSYSRFMGLIHKAKIGLDRKSLAYLAEHEPKVFEELVKTVKK
ncbi:MAG: 50S ribosomal protein L20 [Patescibacteria group bacterium]